MGRLRTPWTSQPKFLTGLSSEFARPTFAFNAATGLVDIVANAAITKSNVTTKPSIAGVGLQTTATGTNDGIYTLSSLAADTTPFSVLIVVKIGAVSGDVGLFQWAGSTGATGSPHALIKNTTGNLQIYGSAVGYVATQTGVLTAGSVHSIVLTFDGTTAYLCRNGQVTSAGGPWIGAGAVKTHAWFDNGFNTVDTGNAVYAGAIWSGKALPVAKALALSRNPWQLFQPLARNVYFGVPTAGGVGNASGNFDAVTITPPTATGAGCAAASGSLASVSIAGPTATASGGAAGNASGSVDSVTLTPPTATATGKASASATPSSVSITPPTATASAGGTGNAFATFMALVLSPATAAATGGASASGLFPAITITGPTAFASGDAPVVGTLDADRFDYARALRIPNAYGPDPAIARMGQRMIRTTRRTRW